MEEKTERRKEREERKKMSAIPTFLDMTPYVPTFRRNQMPPSYIKRRDSLKYIEREVAL
jgi:hypothetical protein